MKCPPKNQPRGSRVRTRGGRTNEAVAVHGGSDHRDPEGAGGRQTSCAAVPQARHKRCDVLCLEEQVRRARPPSLRPALTPPRLSPVRRKRRYESGLEEQLPFIARDAFGKPLERHTGTPTERRHDGRIAVDRPDVRRGSEGFEIGCDNGERVRIAFTLDCRDREAVSWVATTGGIVSSDIRDLMIRASSAASVW